MSKHNNKHWLREKEYISLKKELEYLHDITPRYPRWRQPQNSRLSEVKEKLSQKFYNEYNGYFNSAPWWYRNMLNRAQRAKSKQVLHKIIKGDDENYIFEDIYKDAHWYW
jgi:cation transport regulator ChaB